MTRHLADYVESGEARFADRPAVFDPAGWHVTYAELNRRADALAAFLADRGVRHGDRVGVVLPKSVAAVVSLFAVMKAGAAYVPVDYTAPADRGRRILTDCQVRAVIVHQSCLEVCPDAITDPVAAVVVVGTEDTGYLPSGSEEDTRYLLSFPDALARGAALGRQAPLTPRSDADLAYILYTSGSTGMPKGVMLTHQNATNFVDWCSAVFAPTEHDRFSSHAPFHFDLSVLDIYVSLKHGAALHLISEDLGKDPKRLAQFIADNRLTIWYSTPSILTLLVQFGRLEQYDCSSLRLVLFAGEVFPVKHLRAVQQQWPAPAYYNLYGPTETNVCTFARIPQTIPEDREVPYPIGPACAHCRPLVLDANGIEVQPGEEGLLYMSGPSVFQGYWNRPVENAGAFIERDGLRWYNTGDVVRWAPEEGFIYVGRHDRMVKRRGYRIELGEIERSLYLHPMVHEAAVIAIPDPDSGVVITACLSCHEGDRPSIIQLKTFCAANLPAYMSPDRFVFHDRLPRTSTDKVDYQTLRRQLVEASPAAGNSMGVARA
jgi:L-proline---[L-prolyl-carrier protein] ligase